VISRRRRLFIGARVYKQYGTWRQADERTDKQAHWHKYQTYISADVPVRLVSIAVSATVAYR